MNEWRRQALPAGLIIAGILLLVANFPIQNRSADFPAEIGSGAPSPTNSTDTPVTSVPASPDATETGSTLLANGTRAFRPSPTTAQPAEGATAVYTSTEQSERTSQNTTVSASIPSDLNSETGKTPTLESGPAADQGQIPWLARFGTCGGLGLLEPAIGAGLPFGSYFNWRILAEPFSIQGIEFWQTIRLSQEGIIPGRDDILAGISANPASVWMIGNEPDVVWQDNVTPERYAVLYGELYSLIKAHDPAARIAIGGVAQPTPLRRAYLDMVLDSYRSVFGDEMPIDVWTVHAYILREQAGSWGVDIPPGIDAESGELYEIGDHGDTEIFRQNLIDFRAWMFARGYGDRPLAVTEFGIVMPPDYGFPDDVKSQFMTEALDFLSSAVNETGYGADGGRLFQRWFWYSLYDTPDGYPAGNLMNRDSGQVTPIGRTWAAYAENRRP